jgi:hypothetical protein
LAKPAMLKLWAAIAFDCRIFGGGFHDLAREATNEI